MSDIFYDIGIRIIGGLVAGIVVALLLKRFFEKDIALITDFQIKREKRKIRNSYRWLNSRINGILCLLYSNGVEFVPANYVKRFINEYPNDEKRSLLISNILCHYYPAVLKEIASLSLKFGRSGDLSPVPTLVSCGFPFSVYEMYFPEETLDFIETNFSDELWREHKNEKEKTTQVLQVLDFLYELILHVNTQMKKW